MSQNDHPEGPGPERHMDGERLEALFLAELARELGAHDAALVEVAEIMVRDKLAGLCRTGCPNYGKSLSCPPHVAGPEEMRRLAGAGRFALVVKLDATRDEMLSAKRREVMQRLHRLVAGVERAARERGFSGARAFAGGGCKDLFCADQKDCRVLAGRGECRNPDLARPSMSGFGVDVSLLARSAGWGQEAIGPESWSKGEALLPAYGLILLGQGPAGEDQ